MWSSTPIVREPLAWKPLEIRRASGVEKPPEPIEGSALADGHILYLRPHPSGFVQVGVIAPTDREPGRYQAQMPDLATAKHLIEHARNLGPLPRPTLMLAADRFSVVQVLTDESGDGGQVRRWYGVREAGTYVIEVRSQSLRLTFERDDNPSLSEDLLSFASASPEPYWPDYLAGRSAQIALAQRLITLHAAALARADR